MVAMDAINYLTNGRLGLSLTRFLQIDIDDMFVGRTGIRTQYKDAEAMKESQIKIRKYVPDFHYVLGFSGDMYLDGTPEEQAGDRRILELVDEFVWFDHMYKHEQPHKMNSTQILKSMTSNKIFAQEHNIKPLKDYSVMPHHSGVYPIHEPLYDIWSKSDILATSTTDYPRQFPLWERRGFIYRGIMVVPRQSCNLYTKTNFFNEYHGGKEALDESINGGFLFKIFLHTEVMVFMTHMSNYANDQLAQYSFENVLAFLNTWTNIQVQSGNPVDIAHRYFSLYPNEATPVWTNPCDYNKHLEIWPSERECMKLPKFVIVGPQKTGTTALYTFLQAHPNLVTSNVDSVFYEEIQFFNGKNYLNGLKWYLNRFPPMTDDNKVYYEKSANYFDNESTPKRMLALLPKAKILIILSDPIRRAYSWYQHMRSHNDPVAINYTFFEVVTATESAPKMLRDMNHRCLLPGMYALHIARWLQFYPKNQVYLVDGEKLNKSPVSVMMSLQKFLKVQPIIDYSQKLRFDTDKGFFCLVDKGCLKDHKGRKYSPMDPESLNYLSVFYRDYNANLRTLLTDIGRPYPDWLRQQ